MNRSEALKTSAPHLKPAEIPNAFIGRATAPTRMELDQVLGDSALCWHQIVRELEHDGITAEEWTGVYPNKYGWTFRLKQKARNILYLSPCQGCFRAAFILSDRALQAAQKAALPKPVKAALAHAPKYPEGNGVRLTIRTPDDLTSIRKLAAIKMAS
ncbi:MAG: DUF3788 family protein [Acidobacteriota bacterium]